MHICSRHIICLMTALFLALAAQGQTDSDRNEKLNRYELACRQCLEMRSRVSSGEKVPKDEAVNMINAFVTMNAEIKSDSTLMTASQKARFEAVNRWFSTGLRPKMLDHGVLIETLDPAPRSEALTRMVPHWPPASGKTAEIRDTDALFRPQFIIMAGISAPQISYGLIAGAMTAYHPGHISWGGYAHFNSDFRFSAADYSCNSDGTMADGGRFWPSGKSRTSVMRATGGVLAGINGWLTVYGGAGYGYSRLMWEDVEGKWAEVGGHSYKGMTAEAGIMASWNHLTFGLGVSTISFRTASVDVSVGIKF